MYYSYGSVSQAIHKIVLGNRHVRSLSFEIERAIFSQHQVGSTPDYTLITSLPRSGTTVLLNSLHETGKFASLTYLDMPFVLCPNLWTRLSFARPASVKQIVRYHDDNVKISVQSPEAFEEVFWQTFEEGHSDFAERYIAYIQLVLARYGLSRYLSKSNQNFCRIQKIISILPKAKIVIPFRDPFDQSISLCRQHQRFKKLQTENTFNRTYMDMIGHREFGLGYAPVFKDNLQYKNPDELEHWLEQWFLGYSYAFNLACNNENVKLLSYEMLCKNRLAFNDLCNFLRLEVPPSSNFVLTTHRAPEGLNQELSSCCQNLYARLLDEFMLSSRLKE